MTPTRRFTIEGHDLGYPTSFRDGASMMAAFVVPLPAATRLIAESEFRPAQVLPGRGVMSMNCVHYVDSDCGTYDEVALAILVEDPSAPTGRTRLASRLPRLRTWRSLVDATIGAHSWRLGVSTTLSRDCGIQMWGFPKVVGDVSFTRHDTTAAMSWFQDGELVLRYRGPATGSRTPAEISPPVYSILGGRPHVGYLKQRYTGVGYHLRGGSIDLGPHTFADELRSLGLPRRPLVSVWNEHLSFEMSAPQPISGGQLTHR